jgi:threonine aldolase
MIDLRSDTITRPTPAMRHAMAHAEVGDDVYGEDPTVNQLEAEAARLFGKEAGLFVPTGVMGNTIAIKAHTQHGQEVICDSRAHILDYELAMMAWFAGCVARPVSTEDGLLNWPLIAPHLRGNSPHCAPTGLIAIENTHNMAGGTIYDQEQIDNICHHAHERSLPVHMDGARIFHAQVASGLSVHRMVQEVDSVMFCLSKGLCAPVGSLLVGDEKFIRMARPLRKRLGGGMRQAGVLAAAGLIALHEMTARLAEDHEKAAAFAHAISCTNGVFLDASRVKTNIIIFTVDDRIYEAGKIVEALALRDVKLLALPGNRIRAVTHHDVTLAQCLAAAKAMEDVMQELSALH